MGRSGKSGLLKTKEQFSKKVSEGLKRKSDDGAENAALKLKKKKKIHSYSSVSSGSPVKTQDSTEKPTLQDNGLKVKKSGKLSKSCLAVIVGPNSNISKLSSKPIRGKKAEEQTPFSPLKKVQNEQASNELKQKKKKKPKHEKLTQEDDVNRVSTSATAGDKSIVANTDRLKKKKKKVTKKAQNQTSEGVAVSSITVSPSTNKSSESKQVKKKKKKSKFNKDTQEKPKAPGKNLGSSSESPLKSLQKKTKNKLHNKSEKKNFTDDTKPGLINQNKNILKHKKGNKSPGSASRDGKAPLKNKKSRAPGETSAASHKTKPGKFDKPKSPESVKTNTLKGKALKRKIANISKTLTKLKEFRKVHLNLAVKAQSEEKKNQVEKKIKNIDKKIKTFESELALFQNNKSKPVETVNQKVFKGLPADQPLAKKKVKQVELTEFLQKQLKASRFRWINENLYSSSSTEAQGFFKEDPESFKAYHEGYSEQVSKWPVNPLDVITKDLNNFPKDSIVADLGCGEAKLAASLPNLKVHSLDFVALKPEVIACDMAHCPLLRSSVDVAVFCLSLMGTNVSDFLLEANRILKTGGTMVVAEVESRFENIDDFISDVEKYGFKLTKKNLMDMFFFLSFNKTADVNKSRKLPDFNLKACLYKKR